MTREMEETGADLAQVGNHFPADKDPALLDDEQLATLVADGVKRLAVFSEALKPYYLELRARFRDKKSKTTKIHGCATWDEYCEKVLDRCRRAVNYWLAGGNPGNEKAKQERKARIKEGSTKEGPAPETGTPPFAITRSPIDGNAAWSKQDAARQIDTSSLSSPDRKREITEDVPAKLRDEMEFELPLPPLSGQEQQPKPTLDEWRGRKLYAPECNLDCFREAASVFLSRYHATFSYAAFAKVFVKVGDPNHVGDLTALATLLDEASGHLKMLAEAMMPEQPPVPKIPASNEAIADRSGAPNGLAETPSERREVATQPKEYRREKEADSSERSEESDEPNGPAPAEDAADKPMRSTREVVQPETVDPAPKGVANDLANDPRYLEYMKAPL